MAQGRQHELEEFDVAWTTQTTQWGVRGVELEDMHDWLAKRDEAIGADDDLQEKATELRLEQDAAADSHKLLSAAMVKAGIDVAQNMTLAEMIANAQAYVDDAKTLRATKSALHYQQAGKLALEQAKQATSRRANL